MLKDGNNILKAVQKLLINTVRETTQHRKPATSSSSCPMFKVSRDFIIVSLVGSRAVENHLQEEQHAITVLYAQLLHRSMA